MKKTLIWEFQRTQFLNILVFSLLVFLSVGFFCWNQTIINIKERLFTLDKVLEVTLQEYQPSLTTHLQTGDEIRLRELIESQFQKIIRCYPSKFTVGFYSSKFDRVIVSISNHHIEYIDGEVLLPNDPGRKPWKTGLPQYTFRWSSIRRAFLLKCDYPVTVNGRIIGHTFSYITLSSLILLCFNIGLTLLIILTVAGYLSFVTSRRTTQNIRKNAEQLLSAKPDFQFDYVEFEKIASELWLNQEYRQRMVANCPWGYILVSADGMIIDMNDNGLAMLGFKYQQVIGANLTDWDKNAPVLRVLKTKTSLVEEIPFILPTGEHKVFYTYSFPVIVSPGEEGATAWFLDITERANTQKIIDESNAKIVNILESISESFFALNKDWRFTYINYSAEKHLLKRRKEELLGKSIWEEYPASIYSRHYHEYHRVMNERVPLYFEAPDIDIWLEFHVYPADEGILVFVHDITGRKLAERTTQQLAAIVETSEDAIISMTPDGKISSWNQGAMKMYCYTAEEAIGKSYLMIVPVELHDTMRKILKKLNQGQFFDDNRAIRIRRDNTPVYVSIKFSLIRNTAGNIVEISSIHRDITERIQYEEALAKERELLMVTLNSLSEGVIATDSEGRIFLMNEVAANLTGYLQKEAIGEPLEKIFYIIDDRTSEPIINIISKSPFQIPHQLVLVTRDLNEVFITVHCSPLKSLDARIIGAVTVFQDITEKQKTEQELFKADKLESLGILAGGIAHDFNNLLAAILSNIQLAQMKYRKHEDIEKYFQESIEATHRASDLTRQLLTFSKGGAPVKKTASLAELIRDTAKFALRGSRVKVECKISRTLWPVEADAGQISQVLYNLIINAKQAMPKGGIIKISAENITVESNQRFNPGNYIKITTKDYGTGISKENLPKIFDPFFTTKKEGSGLGLTTSYSIVRQHEGYLEVESEMGIGTTFFIYLPAITQTAFPSEVKKEPAVTGGKLKILLMDDEETILKSVGEMLELFGHQVVLAADGSKAIEEYEQVMESDAPFDVVIMDLTVPGGMGGQETIAYLRDIDPKIKAIVSSGYANDPIMADYERFGFCGVVTKPYKFDELNEVVNRVLELK